jgi:hypothetical protein
VGEIGGREKGMRGNKSCIKSPRVRLNKINVNFLENLIGSSEFIENTWDLWS